VLTGVYGRPSAARISCRPELTVKLTAQQYKTCLDGVKALRHLCALALLGPLPVLRVRMSHAAFRTCLPCQTRSCNMCDALVTHCPCHSRGIFKPEAMLRLQQGAPARLREMDNAAEDIIDLSLDPDSGAPSDTVTPHLILMR